MRIRRRQGSDQNVSTEVNMGRAIYFLIGILSFTLGVVGAVVPLLPTVPLLIFAAFCFARSSPVLERRIVEHPVMKPHISAWRDQGAISSKGKVAAVSAFAVSAIVGLLILPLPVSLTPILVGAVGGAWILKRPTA